MSFFKFFNIQMGIGTFQWELEPGYYYKIKKVVLFCENQLANTLSMGSRLIVQPAYGEQIKISCHLKIATVDINQIIVDNLDLDIMPNTIPLVSTVNGVWPDAVECVVEYDKIEQSKMIKEYSLKGDQI